MNVDGSARGHPGSAASGGVIRNAHGDWLGGFTHRVGISYILTAELWAIFHGLQLCWDRGYRKIELESDSLVAIQKLGIKTSLSDPHIHIIDAIKEFQQHDWICNIKHVHREANHYADWMATHFDNLSLGLHIFSSPPIGISHCFLADMSSLAWPRFM
ncbi:hypothetical protein REPUB_Repub06bG0093400 [Reevesia pubescens]